MFKSSSKELEELKKENEVLKKDNTNLKEVNRRLTLAVYGVEPSSDITDFIKEYADLDLLERYERLRLENGRLKDELVKSSEDYLYSRNNDDGGLVRFHVVSQEEYNLIQEYYRLMDDIHAFRRLFGLENKWSQPMG
ncbi:MAG: hypothetical protein IJH63_10120 [Methanobrevibacter sp.]|nr:hypothetical protein [Methanosphaera sp.]MBR0371054.1 hypothetical protein [Methanobrevibacter sp.]